MNPFPYAFDNKRYHTLAYHNHIHNCKTQKAVIDADFSCPNLDGTCGTGGCIFCDGGSGYFTADKKLSVSAQFALEAKRIRAKAPNAKLVAYFQAHTNTYAPPEKLRALYREAMDAGADALAVATRPDCLPVSVIELLSDISREIPLTVELGLQTSNDETACKINRGYPFSVFCDAMERLHEAGLRTCVHLIDGLPGEGMEEMTKTARDVATLCPAAVKIHLLHVISGTALAVQYTQGLYQPMTMEAYIDTVIRQLELLPPEIVIERITGDGDRKKLLAPRWSLNKICVLGTIDSEMARRNTWQGRLSL